MGGVSAGSLWVLAVLLSSFPAEQAFKAEHLEEGTPSPHNGCLLTTWIAGLRRGSLSVSPRGQGPDRAREIGGPISKIDPQPFLRAVDASLHFLKQCFQNCAC